MNKIAAAITLVFISVCSCVSRPVSGEHYLYTWLTDTSKYALLPPACIEKNIDMAQHISASFQGQDYYFNAWVQANETEMSITLLNEMGAAMGEIAYRDGTAHIASQVFPESLKPEYIIADFQLCFYNPQPLGEALKQCGLVLETEGESHRVETRRILKRKEIIIEIEKNKNEVNFINHLRGYRYTLGGDFT